MAGNSRDGTGDSATTSPRWRALWPWLLLSLLLHALALRPGRQVYEQAPPASPVALQWRLLPVPRAPDSPGTAGDGIAAAQEVRAVRSLPAPASRAKPGAAKREAAESQSLRAAWPPSGRWQYRLSSQGESGEAEISWLQDGVNYRLELHRQTATRKLPTWRSEGLLLAEGLQPLRFSTLRGARAQTRLRFDREVGRLAGTQGIWLPAPALTQDRLSWMWQLAALAASQPLRPGQRLHLDVASWQGEAHRWQLMVEKDPEAPLLLRLRRQPPEGSLLSLSIWLDPARGHLPVRLQQRYDDAERWEIELQPTTEPPPP